MAHTNETDAKAMANYHDLVTQIITDKEGEIPLRDLIEEILCAYRNKVVYTDLASYLFQDTARNLIANVTNELVKATPNANRETFVSPKHAVFTYVSALFFRLANEGRRYSVFTETIIAALAQVVVDHVDNHEQFRELALDAVRKIDGTLYKRELEDEKEKA